jgi:two-component system, sensor histidine kinase PdtaS
VLLPVDRAIPCGLVLNELITNAVKHAFPDVAEGVLRVSLRQTTPGRLMLGVGDNGVGMPTGFDISSAATLGMQLVTTLAEQLDAVLQVTARDPGVEITLEFDTQMHEEPA